MTTATEGTELQSADTQDEGGKGKEPLDLGHEVMPKQPVTAATATEPDEGEDTGKVSNGIPRARMNEVIRQREAAQAEAEELRREIERLRAGQGGAAHLHHLRHRPSTFGPPRSSTHRPCWTET